MELLLILLEGGMEFLGTPLWDSEDFLKLLIKGAFNLGIVILIVRYIYYPVTKNKDYLFTYLLISLTVFLLCILLDSVKLQLGFALGLFAIFGIIRYQDDEDFKDVNEVILVKYAYVFNNYMLTITRHANS